MFAATGGALVKKSALILVAILGVGAAVPSTNSIRNPQAALDPGERVHAR